jgi:hypothetical protein
LGIAEEEDVEGSVFNDNFGGNCCVSILLAVVLLAVEATDVIGS